MRASILSQSQWKFHRFDFPKQDSKVAKKCMGSYGRSEKWRSIWCIMINSVRLRLDEKRNDYFQERLEF